MSETNKSIKINVIWNTILSLSSIIFPFITFPYITRVLGVEVNGIISFSSATINYFSLFCVVDLMENSEHSVLTMHLHSCFPSDLNH